MTLKDSGWVLSLSVFHQPEIIGQPKGTSVWWGHGLYPERNGDFVRKPMTACTGAEILEETLQHGTRAEIDDTIAMLTSNLDKITEHGRRADGIVQSMLQHSRGGSGDWQEVDLNALVDEALNLAYHGARAEDQSFNITMERDLDRALAPIEVVPQDVTRVFLNLIGNGFYAANKRSREAGDGFRPGAQGGDARPPQCRRGEGAGQRHRHRAGAPRETVPAVLHDQADRRGHGPWSLDQPRHRHNTARRHDHRGQRSRGVHRVHRAPAAAPARSNVGEGR